MISAWFNVITHRDESLIVSVNDINVLWRNMQKEHPTLESRELGVLYGFDDLMFTSNIRFHSAARKTAFFLRFM